MKAVLQTRKGIDGNCWAACLASIFEVSIEETEPCSCNHADWWDQTVKFLRRYALFSLEVECFKDADGSLRKWPFVAPPNGTICILKGRSINELQHVVIAETRIRDDGHLDFMCVHDPLGIGAEVLTTAEVVIFFGALINKKAAPQLAGFSA